MAANSSNTATIQVNVATAGTYAISTTDVDGITFSASGNFSATGSQTITLSANGTPTAAGTFQIPITAGSSNCSFQLIVVTGTPAVYALNGAPDTCTGATADGTYAIGTALTSSNTATIQVNVTTPGTYSITTTATNGITFTGSGIFSSTGIQSVVLIGHGTPTVAGDNTIPITVGASSCTFVVTVAAGSTNQDLFPLTANSWWSYDDDVACSTSAGDSLKRVNIATGTYQGNNMMYNIFQDQDNTSPIDSFYYRRASDDYYELNIGDFYTIVYWV